MISLLDLDRKEVIKKFWTYRSVVNGKNFFKYYPDFDINFYKTSNSLLGDDKDICDEFWKYGQFQSKQYRNKYTIVFYLDKINDAVGGANILLYTAHKINQMKHPKISAKIYTANGVNIANRFVSENDYATPFEFTNNHTVVVYPENIKGNPLKGKNVIRWILLKLDYVIAKNKFWKKKDRIYSWEPHDVFSRLTLPMHPKNMFDCEIKNNYKNLKTIDSVHLIKKARLLIKDFNNYTIYNPSHKDLNQHPIHSICLDEKDSLYPQEMIKMFDSSKYFYCYDINTFWAVIAPLCGCITILCPPNKPLDRTKYFQDTMLYHPSGYTHTAGIATNNSKEEIEIAQKTLSISNDSITKLIDLYEKDFMLWLEKDVIEYLDKINKK